MKDIKAVIFDLDDTLISEFDYIKSGFQVVSVFLEKKYNLDKNNIYKSLLDYFSVDSTSVFNNFFKNNQIEYSKEDILELVNIYRTHVPNIKFYNDVIPTLIKLKKNGYKLGIITDGYKETQRNKLKVLDMMSFVDYIVVTDELGKNQEFWKPHPKPFELMKENLLIDFNEMVYIGDNPKKDFYIKSIYPIKTIRIERDGYKVYINQTYLENIKEDITINKLSEITSLLQGDNN